MQRLVVALVVALGLTGGAFLAGYLLLFSAATDRAAALAPANSAFYLNVYLQPSAGQQMNLGGLIGRLPGFADDASLDQKVDQVVQNLLAGTGVDYRDQVKPWLGNQVAIAAWPTADGPASPAGVVIAEVKDRPAAEAAAADLVGDGGASFSPQTYEGVELWVGDAGAYAFVGEMLVIGDAPQSIQAVIDVERGGDALAGRAEFRATLAGLAPDHLASVFVDLAAVAEGAGAADQLSAISTAGAVLVAERDGLRVSGSAPFDMEAAAPSSRAGFALGSDPSSLVDWMPEDTIAELVVFGLRQTLTDAEAALAATPDGAEVTGMLDTIRVVASFGLGIDIDADLLPLLDREVGIALTGFEGPLPSGQIILRPDDPDAAEAAITRIADRLEATGAAQRVEMVAGEEIVVLDVPDIGEVAYTIVDGIVIIGLGAQDVGAAITAHRDGSVVSANEDYGLTFEVAGERAGNEAWVDIGALVELIGPGLDVSDDVRDILGQIGTFGFTAPSRDNEIVFHAILTVDEARPE